MKHIHKRRTRTRLRTELSSRADRALRRMAGTLNGRAARMGHRPTLALLTFLAAATAAYCLWLILGNMI